MPDVGPYRFADLPYPYDALEPVIDSETMRVHHDRHHRAYVDALNAALAAHPELQGKTIEALLSALETIPEPLRATVRNQGGGHANHQLFWKVMAPPSQAADRPSGALLTQIESDFGSVDAMKERFEAAGCEHLGSGWVELVIDPHHRRLEVITLANQDSALLVGKPALLANDLWEHAYYLKHRNRRAEYLRGWWAVVDWPYVAKRFDAIRSGNVQSLGGPAK